WIGWIVLAVFAVAATRWALRRPRSRARIHALLWRAPLLGRLLRSLDASRLAATLSILVGSRVPILNALEAGGGVMTLTPMRHARRGPRDRAGDPAADLPTEFAHREVT